MYVIFLHELPGSSTGGRLLAQVEPHLLQGRAQLQGLARHLQEQAGHDRPEGLRLIKRLLRTRMFHPLLGQVALGLDGHDDQGDGGVGGLGGGV